MLALARMIAKEMRCLIWIATADLVMPVLSAAWLMIVFTTGIAILP